MAETGPAPMEKCSAGGAWLDDTGSFSFHVHCSRWERVEFAAEEEGEEEKEGKELESKHDLTFAKNW